MVTALAQASTSSADSSGSRSVLLVAEHLGSTVFGGPVMFSDIADLAGDTFGDTPTSRCLLLLFFSAGLFTLPRLDVGAVGSGRSLRYRSKVPVSFNLKWLFVNFLVLGVADICVFCPFPVSLQPAPYTLPAVGS